MTNTQPHSIQPRLMRIIPYRIFMEILGTFLMFQVGMTVVLIFIGLLQGMLGGLPRSHVPMLIPCVLPFSQSFATPFSVLFTSVAVYTRMSMSREIVALQTCGISAIRVIIPCLGLGLVTSFYTLWMTDMNTSWGMAQTQRVFLSASQEILYHQLKTEKAFTFDRDNLKFTVSSVEGKTIRGVIITRINDDSANSFSVVAEEAVIEVGRPEDLIDDLSERENVLGSLYTKEEYREGVLKITCFNVQSTSQEAGAILTIKSRQVMILPLSNLPFFQSTGANSPSRVAISRLPEFIEQRRQSLHQLQEDMRLAAVEQLVFGNFAGLSDQQWQQWHEQIRVHNRDISRAKMEPYRRWVNGFSCFCFAILGAPLAAWRGKYGALQLIAAALVPVVGFYYPLILVTTKIGKSGALSPVGLWLPNIALILMGIYFLRRAA